MAVNANTVETYDVSTIREDLSEAYSMISPEECPFQNMAGSRSVSQKQYDWTVVDLQAPDAGNRVAEGDVDVGNDDPTLAKRIYNVCQISGQGCRKPRTRRRRLTVPLRTFSASISKWR
jgi:hypothetical protein